MLFNTDPGFVVDIASGLLLLALGVGVLLVRPRLRANIALAVFGIAFGGAFVAINLLSAEAPEKATADVSGAVLAIIAASALVALVLLFPRPLARRERRLGLVAAIVTAGLAAFSVIASRGFPLGSPTDFAYHVVQPAFWFALLLLPLRFAQVAADGAKTNLRPFALMSTALLFYPGYVAGGYLMWQAAAQQLTIGLPGIVAMALSAVLWLRGTSPAMRSSRMARNVAWLSLVLPLAGVLVAAAFGPHDAANGPPGAARTLTVAVLAYAILRHQLLGIDVKVRWTLSRTTLAGLFIATFFIISEAAQQFFGEQFENGYLGVAAAGALVFAIAPLSRIADRLAERAIPVASDDAASPSRREDVYRKALRIALRDRRLGGEEELHLAELAEELGIGAARTLVLRREVEEGMTGRRARQ